MVAVIQRVTSASVSIGGEIRSSIQRGLLVLVGIEDADGDEDLEWLAMKISAMRIFNDGDGVMNLSAVDVGGEALVVSQFTLMASTKKGNRPSYIRAAKAPHAVPVYEKFVRALERHIGKPVRTGEFGADMKVELINDGPVTIVVDTRNRV